MQTEVGRAPLVSESCPGCGSRAPLSAYGVIAPFVAELVGLPLEQRVGYRECGSCGLAFFDLRYSESQVETLYGGYRDAEYFRTRRSWEPWYREDVNNAFLPGSAPVEDRVRFASRVLALGGVPSSLTCAVDFGGDQGQFFPRLPIRRRMVVELSEKPLLPGVERVSSLQNLPVRPDLILATHVLEHLSDPRRLVSDIFCALAPAGILYVEVPLRSLRSLLESGGFKVVAELAEPHARMGRLRFGRLGMAAVCARGNWSSLT